MMSQEKFRFGVFSRRKRGREKEGGAEEEGGFVLIRTKNDFDKALEKGERVTMNSWQN